jgi:hypothetical protein
MKAWTALLGVLVGVCVVEARADETSGNEQLEMCTKALMIYERGAGAKNVLEGMMFGECLAHIEGVRDTMINYNNQLPKSSQTCFPKSGGTNGQSVRIVLKYLNEHPKDLHENRTLLTINALHSAYPCK